MTDYEKIGLQNLEIDENFLKNCVSLLNSTKVWLCEGWIHKIVIITEAIYCSIESDKIPHCP